MTRVADDVLEEGRSAVKMTCTSDANPPGRVFWRKYGASEERQFVETLEFNPVMRKDSGTYVCQAENAIGLSAEETVELDVLCKFLKFRFYEKATKFVKNLPSVLTKLLFLKVDLF